MTIAHRGGATDIGSATSWTPTEDAASAENDFMLLVAFVATTDGVFTDPADFTELDQFTETGGSPDSRVYIGYKRRGATAGSGYNITYSGTAANGGSMLVSYSGVHLTAAFDVTYAKASHYDASLNDENAAAAAITTVNDNAMVVLLQMMNSNAVTAFGPPTSFNQRTAVGGASSNFYSCDQLKATAGLVTPGAYGHTGNATQDQRQFTIALQEAVTATSKLAIFRRLRG